MADAQALSDLPAGLSESWAELGDVTLHYVEKGSGPLVLFLHGFPQFWWLWREQLADLGESFRAVAPDMRGYNLSSRPPEVEAYRMRHLIADVRGLAAALGGERFVLVGHDWGGIVGWAFTLKHPELVERLVILDAPPPFTWGRELAESTRQRGAVRYMVDLSSPHGEELCAANDFAVLDSLLIEPGVQRGFLTESDRARYHAAWSQPGALTGGLNYYRAAGMGEQVQHGQPAEVRAAMESRRVEVPTLVIWGAEDHYLLPPLTSGLERWVADLRVEILPGAGHWTPQERPAEVNALIREFLRD